MPAHNPPLYRHPYVWTGAFLLLLGVLALTLALGRRAPAPPAPGQTAPPPADARAAAPAPAGAGPGVADDSTAAAYRMAQVYIKRTLRRPDEARFPSEAERDGHVARVGEGLYRVMSYVDAPNEMGETVRVTFVVDVRHLSGDNWQMAALEVDGKKLF